MLRVDYEALAAGSKTLQDQGAIFEECIDRMRQVIESLPDVWEADTSKRYVEQFQEAEPGLKNVRQMIEDMAVQMQKIYLITLHRQIAIWLDKCKYGMKVGSRQCIMAAFLKRRTGRTNGRTAKYTVSAETELRYRNLTKK